MVSFNSAIFLPWPNGRLNFVELMVEFVDKSVKETFHGTSNLIAPLALPICCWIFLMNLMDLVPVDLVPYLAMAAGVEYMKIVPTTDVNATLGMSIGVFFLIILRRIKKSFFFNAIHPAVGL